MSTSFRRVTSMLPDLCIDEKAVVIILFNKYPSLKILSLAKKGDHYVVEAVLQESRVTVRVTCSGDVPVRDRIELWLRAHVEPRCRTLLQRTLQPLLSLVKLGLHRAQVALLLHRQRSHT